jgi:DNA-binding SARP family transcriptional activator
MAARLWGAAEVLREQMGMSLSKFDLANSEYERDLAAVISALEGASFDAAWAEGRAMSSSRSSLHDTIYRLRRALCAKEWVSFRKGRYAFGRSLEYSYDVEAFEWNVSEARRVQAEVPDQAIRHLQKAADLYGGDYLEDLAVEGEWAFERQEELRRSYQEALLELGGLLSTQDRNAEAAEAYRKAIAHDRFLEEAHRGLMRSQAALGERGKALRHYEELVRHLEDELGASPAPETSALRKPARGSLRGVGVPERVPFVLGPLSSSTASRSAHVVQRCLIPGAVADALSERGRFVVVWGHDRGGGGQECGSRGALPAPRR